MASLHDELEMQVLPQRQSTDSMISSAVVCFRQSTQQYLDEQYYICGLEPWGHTWLGAVIFMLMFCTCWLPGFWKSPQPYFATFRILAHQPGSFATAGPGADQQLGSQCSMLKSAATDASADAADAADGDMTSVNAYHA